MNNKLDYLIYINSITGKEDILKLINKAVLESINCLFVFNNNEELEIIREEILDILSFNIKAQMLYGQGRRLILNSNSILDFYIWNS